MCIDDRLLAVGVIGGVSLTDKKCRGPRERTRYLRQAPPNEI